MGQDSPSQTTQQVIAMESAGESGDVPVSAISLLGQDEQFVRNEVSLLGAEQLLIESCMSESGFTYLAADGANLVTPLFLSVPDIERRGKVGYGIGLRLGDGAPPANDAYVRSLPAEVQVAYQAALFGEGKGSTVDLPDGRQQDLRSGGCIGAARSQIYGSVDNWVLVEPVMSSHASLVGNLLESNGRFLDALASWSTCMADHGYQFAGPQAAHDYVQNLVNVDDPDARSKEIETAVQDAHCAVDVGIPGSINEVAAEYFTSLEPEDQAKVVRAAGSRADAVRNAESTLAKE